MSFLRRMPLVVVVTLGCRMGNPGFEDGEFADELGTEAHGSGEATANDEVVDGSGSSDGVDTSTSTSSNDGVDTTSTSTSSSEGVDTSTSSSDGVDTSSSSSEEGSTSTSTEGSTEGMLTEGFEAPIVACVLNADESCLSCMQNNCCMDADLDMPCFGDPDSGCYCVLQCLINGDGMLCVDNCQAELSETAHAQSIYECGLVDCDLCGP